MASLAGEEEGDLGVGFGVPAREAGGGLSLRQCEQLGVQLVMVGGDRDGAVGKLGAVVRQRARDVLKVLVGVRF